MRSLWSLLILPICVNAGVCVLELIMLACPGLWCPVRKGVVIVDFLILHGLASTVDALWEINPCWRWLGVWQGDWLGLRLQCGAWWGSSVWNLSKGKDQNVIWTRPYVFFSNAGHREKTLNDQTTRIMLIIVSILVLFWRFYHLPRSKQF